ncbi:MAG: hypothetical protein LBR73_06965 [Oscillospiraceae bacterium]|jgi:triacylglycerol lipase|nr:hypothetical protein [Oscillospiraceae bacterium]
MRKRLLCFLLTAALLAGLALPCFAAGTSAQTKQKYPIILVHGMLALPMPDWLISGKQSWLYTQTMLNYEPFTDYEVYAPGIGPVSSSWDGACELYAQLTGTTVDYGEAHSKAHNHPRYGKAYTEPLFAGWSKEKKVHLVGHSYGGLWVRMLETLLRKGDAAERKASGKSVSPLFAGGHDGLVASITTLATPHNGVSALELLDLDSLLGPIGSFFADTGMADFSAKVGLDFLKCNGVAYTEMLRLLQDRNDYSYGEVTIDRMKELNKVMTLNPKVYYFSYAVDATEPDTGGVRKVGKAMSTFPLHITCGFIAGDKGGTTAGGYKYGAEWQSNDGLVNTVSAKYPFGQTMKNVTAYTAAKKGIWNVFPVIEGDHAGVVATGFKDAAYLDAILGNILRGAVAIEAKV